MATAVGTGGGAGQTFSGQAKAGQAGQGVAGGGVGVLHAASPIATNTNNTPSTNKARIVCLGIFFS